VPAASSSIRGDLQPGEDPGDFNPNYLRKRNPSLALVALFAILDPPREEAIEAAKVAHNAGITVKMITGVFGISVGFSVGWLVYPVDRSVGWCFQSTHHAHMCASCGCVYTYLQCHRQSPGILLALRSASVCVSGLPQNSVHSCRLC
jgi:magnesium-transporting ATPase (P-type)